MSISWFSVVILLIVITVTLIEVYRGMSRGFFPTLLSLGLMIPCSLTALLIAPALSRSLASSIMDNLVRPDYNYQTLLSMFTSMDSLVHSAAQLIATILMFVLCFLLLRPVFRFICYCFTLEHLSANDSDPGYSREKTSFCYRHNALLGGITGGICAIIISMVITCPFMGALRVADDVIDMAETFDPELWSMTTLSDEDVDTIKKLPKDLPGNLLYEFGGKYMFYATAKTEFDGEIVYLHTELDHVESLFSHLSAVTAILNDTTSVTQEQIDHLKALRDDINNLQVLHGLVSDYFSCCAQVWLNGYPYYGFPQPQMHPVVQPLIDDILLVCTTSDYSTIKANATTLLNTYIYILESELLSLSHDNLDGVLLLLERTQLLTKLEAELEKNPNMEQVRISSVGMQLWGEVIQSHSFTPSYLSIFYENVANALNTVHRRGYGSPEEKIAVLSTYLDKYYAEMKLTIPTVLSDAIATELVYQIPAQGDFTGLEIQEFFSQYN